MTDFPKKQAVKLLKKLFSLSPLLVTPPNIQKVDFKNEFSDF